MKTLTLRINGATRGESHDGVTSFVGADASGSFGILPGRAPFMTVLDYGLARFCDATGAWRYLACPGAVLQLAGDTLAIHARRYLVDQDFARISARLLGDLAREEAELAGVKASLRRMEQELLRRLRELDVWEKQPS